MELYAKGYRNIPVASSRHEPFRGSDCSIISINYISLVSQVITGSTLASFLRMYSQEVLSTILICLLIARYWEI